VGRSRVGGGARAFEDNTSNFKKLVEARISKTGESWSTAAGQVRARVAPPKPSIVVSRATGNNAAGDTPVVGTELAEEKYVRELFERLYCIALRKVPESSAKTYDYDLLEGGRSVAALEIKCFERPPMTAENGWVDEGNGRFSKTGIDKSPSRVGRAIHEKCKQLSTCSGPKVHGNVGHFKNIASRKVAEGLIREEKWTVDLYIWINRYEGRHSFRVDGQPLPSHAEFGPFFSFASEAGYALARQFFGVPEVRSPRRIRRRTYRPCTNFCCARRSEVKPTTRRSRRSSVHIRQPRFVLRWTAWEATRCADPRRATMP
jgi:hypothetical protein